MSSNSLDEVKAEDTFACGGSVPMSCQVDNSQRHTEATPTSLVVCLPAAREGGQLEVRHNGKTVSFDWSKLDNNQPSIQWAAFYSNCEHEVLQVQSGHRITPTYNLYATRGNGELTSYPKPLDLGQLPLYNHIHSIIDQEKFMPDGKYRI
ncbi:hypothetical protein Daesc_001806 [Daldinia eschscholtzii]|uniref:Prolyl 4-hydroxylase alpha subunit Fe(2+) 2OG dioxygenase domain-containing protein n=1 Tax=Daldinia eschscholtzii TaxID=292717 RepID=A0AAX6MV63_9PEZI